ncbi:hypothetical protein [Auritidibacter ignavus]|uniref:hypothetical protein n=1 Tax=Auritidibacter ignavus TaxID=678932 RepID=UPI002447DEA7|nr:hypothetical protein [Auritidibacter ignavus]WGH84118.1 hypothetical protein QDX20_00770 [Auritidibacter ignavus]
MNSTTQRNAILSRGMPERRYLPELHGIRGLALAGVVLFHLFGAGRISGGIDIFLAVSGFLFTGMLLREATAKVGASISGTTSDAYSDAFSSLPHWSP